MFTQRDLQLNTTLGIGGLFDVASEFGLEKHGEDFGSALGHYGVGGGPYLVLPFIGPSNVRDTFGRVVDGFVHPSAYVLYFSDDSSKQDKVQWGYRGISILQGRADLIEAVETAKESSLDYYAFIRAAYHQQRQALIYDGKPPRSAEI